MNTQRSIPPFRKGPTAHPYLTLQGQPAPQAQQPVEEPAEESKEENTIQIKNVEEEILAIVEKYQKENTKLLNYLIVDDEITFFLPLSDNNDISDEDIKKISDIIKGDYISTESINQEYRIKFKYGL